MEDLTFSNLGAIFSKPDYRSRIIAKGMGDMPLPLPEVLLTDTSIFTNFYQGHEPACVSHRTAKQFQIWWYLQTGEIIEPSARWLHKLSIFDGATPEDGRDPVTVMKVGMDIGICTTKTCPNDTSLSPSAYLNFTPTQAMYAEAAKYKIPGFVMVDTDQESLRRAIQRYGTVGLLFEVGKEMFTGLNGVPSWNQADIDPLRPPREVISGHDMLGIGFDHQLERLENSWSDRWANKGQADWIFNEWQEHLFEAISIAQVPANLLKLVKELPAPNEFKHNFTQNLSLGQSGPEVRALQIALAIAGTFQYPQITGFYGSKTAEAVLQFQIKYDVAPPNQLSNGSPVGPKTRSKLNALFNK